MPFAYYSRLSKRDKAIYRRSDKVTEIALPEPERLRPLADAVREAIEDEDRRAVQKAVNALSSATLDALSVPRVKVRVLAVRPSNAESELHGLYEREEDETALIRVWMKTAAKAQVVKYRTFLRTFLHELCHHLDYDHLELADSFHTEGFFKRESSLMRQLAPREKKQKKTAAAAKTKPASRAKPRGAQLELSFD